MDKDMGFAWDDNEDSVFDAWYEEKEELLLDLKAIKEHPQLKFSLDKTKKAIEKRIAELDELMEDC